MRRTISTGLLLLTAILLSPSTAGATVSSIVGSRSWGASDEVAIFRRNTAEFTIHGSLLDLHTALEIRRNGVLVTDPTVTLVARHGSPDTRIVVDLKTDGDTPLGACELWIRYAVEASGPDKVKLHVWDRGAPTLLTISPVQPKAGEPMKVTFTGTGLANAQFKILDAPALNQHFQEGDRTDTKYSFTCVPIYPGVPAGLGGRTLVDRSLPSDLRNISEAGYDPCTFAGGAGFIAPNPIVLGVSRTVSTVGQTLTVSGLNLAANDPARFRTIFRYQPYHPNLFDAAPPVSVPIPDATTASVSFTVPDDFTPGSTQIAIQDVTTGGFTAASTPLFFVRPTHAPEHVSVSAVNGPQHSALRTVAPIATADMFRVFTANDTFFVRSAYANVPLSDLSLSWAGQALTVTDVRYGHQEAVLHALPLKRTTSFTGKLRLATDGGSTTSPSIALASSKLGLAAPAMAALSADDYVYLPAPGFVVFDAPDSTVRRGGSFKIRGVNVSVPLLGTMLKPVLHLIDGAGAHFDLDPLDTSLDNALFLMPANAAPGAARATFEHAGGTVVVSSHLTIAN